MNVYCASNREKIEINDKNVQSMPVVSFKDNKVWFLCETRRFLFCWKNTHILAFRANSTSLFRTDLIQFDAMQFLIFQHLLISNLFLYYWKFESSSAYFNSVHFYYHHLSIIANKNPNFIFSDFIFIPLISGRNYVSLIDKKMTLYFAYFFMKRNLRIFFH